MTDMIDLTAEEEREGDQHTPAHSTASPPDELAPADGWQNKVHSLRLEHQANFREMEQIDRKIRVLQDEKRLLKQKASLLEQRMEDIQRKNEESYQIVNASSSPSSPFSPSSASSSSSLPPQPPPATSSEWSKPFEWSATVRDKLLNVFQFPKFRAGQQEAINATLAGRDIFVIMPTGSGKSLLFQASIFFTRHVSRSSSSRHFYSFRR